MEPYSYRSSLKQVAIYQCSSKNRQNFGWVIFFINLLKEFSLKGEVQGINVSMVTVVEGKKIIQKSCKTILTKSFKTLTLLGRERERDKGRERENYDYIDFQFFFWGEDGVVKSINDI